jgi:LmbE family N-acetylglucosaminyl deacetylase
MKFSRPDADIYIPAANPAHAQTPEAALARVSHLCVAAHQDDIEIMAYAGIVDCLEQPATRAFGGVVVTNGAGSSRAGPYAHYTDDQMQEVRRQEQRKAADIGRYVIQLQLRHASADVKQSAHPGVAADLAAIFSACRPETVYLHNPADKHDTHIAVMRRCIDAIRSLPTARRPARVLGCEVWRDLDWLPEPRKVALDSGRRPALAHELLAVFDSQITGGKRYDLATLGRRAAHATYNVAHASDTFSGITWSLDLTPLVADNAPDIETFIATILGEFQSDVTRRLRAFA